MDGGFEVQGDKTKFATLQRQRKQIYDEIRDSKIRTQSLRRNLLSPTQFEGSSEKLLMNAEMDPGSASPQHFPVQDPRYFAASTPSPCSTPTPPPYNRNRMSPVSSQVSVKTIPKFCKVKCFLILQWSTRSGTNPLMTRVQAGKPAKFITYSCPPQPEGQTSQPMVDHGFIEESLEEASVASSRESRV